MIRIIKEIIIMLLVCLAGMLLFAVLLYKYIPSRKIIPEISDYKATEPISAQLADRVDQEDDKVIKTYEVTNSDLNDYMANSNYVPGKSNPFAAVSKSPSTGGSINPDNPEEGATPVDGGNTGNKEKEENSGGGYSISTPEESTSSK